MLGLMLHVCGLHVCFAFGFLFVCLRLSACLLSGCVWIRICVYCTVAVHITHVRKLHVCVDFVLLVRLFVFLRLSCE